MNLKRILQRKSIKKIIALLAILVVVILISFYLIFATVQKSSEGLIYAAKDAPAKQVALVLGARAYPDGRLSDMFRDRVEVAIGLYKAQKVKTILMSGDHGTKEYDEVNAAKAYLLANGVPGKDIFLDHAGFDTYDSVYRAKQIFLVQSMIVVTQKYHLPRALYIAKSQGMDAVGVDADLRIYGGENYRAGREFLADGKTWLDVALKAKPKYLGAVIPVTGDSATSWD